MSPPTILDTLAAQARQRVEADRVKVPESEMRQRALDTNTRSHFLFEQALRRPGLSFICEVKKASPSKGVIAEEFQPLDIGLEYQLGGASAISVLTEPTHFLGSDQYLRQLSTRVATPLLRKDFTVDPYQIYQARVLGASAVLLICAILSDGQLSEYLDLADCLGLSCLIEAHDAYEVERAVQGGARVIGVNNRNLRDFSVDTANAAGLRSLVPQDRIYVCESGIATPADAAQAALSGADAVLVGESLMKSQNRRLLLRQMRAAADVVRPPMRTNSFAVVKICGITRSDELPVLNQTLPELVGFVFDRSSRRYVELSTAVALRGQLDRRIITVGVFVNAPITQIVRAIRCGAISVVQLHGCEDSAYIVALRQAIGLTPIIKASSLTQKPDLPTATDQQTILYDYALYDNGRPGSGVSFDWSLLKQLDQQVDLPPFFLAGGLTPTTAGQTRYLGAYGVDVSSGVETDQVKDPEKIRDFVNAVRGSMDQAGRFGIHGGQYIPETLMNEIHALEDAYIKLSGDPSFVTELDQLLSQYTGRPSRLYFAKRMTTDLGGAKVYLKREDLNHTGSHKINNVLGQCLLAKTMGKTRVIAETGAGQHGVATATAAALLGLECEIFMGEQDTKRQALNVFRMELLGAKVHPVTSGTQTLKDAVSETMREWTRRVDDTHYVLGSVMGPHPFPMMVRNFQAVIGQEARAQILDVEGKLPAAILACVGGGSNAIGIFYPFINDASVALIGCEAAGVGVDTPRTAATIATGSLGIFHGMKSYFCQDENGQIAPVYSVSAGLDYPGIGPEHAWLHDSGRAKYVPVTDDEAVDGFEYLARIEGIICAIESAHAIAHARQIVPEMSPDDSIIICLSGRGDKDVAAIARYRGREIVEE